MTSHQAIFAERLRAMDTPEFLESLKAIKRGVEREGLRIKPDGKLATTPHPKTLGSALTHECITTDFSESLLEFITPPSADVNETLDQLKDIHRFVASNIGDELLWPLSMPCAIEDADDIPLAYFGESNVGKMKRVYRLGLKNRYGSMMQAIAGVHFNFSLPDRFWPAWAQMQGVACDQDQISDSYFSMIRNYRRYCWLLPYLYGASPALCTSFLKGKTTTLPLQTVGKGTVYLPHATCLRMSDLGYTNAEQSALKICYNKLDTYVEKLREAMFTPSERYSEFAAGEGGNFQQLSKHILQIENELYSPIRPKQPTASMEKPTDALVRRGVNYVEVRVLDVNPFSEVGIDETQMYFLDVFLLSCLVLPSPELDPGALQESASNMNAVVLEGRKPSLMLSRDGENVAFQAWSETLFGYFEQTATLLDKAHGDNRYSKAVASEKAKIADSTLTPSGRILSALLEKNQDNGLFGLSLAKRYAESVKKHDYRFYDENAFIGMRDDSLAAQKEAESGDDKDFATFIRDYFAAPFAEKHE